MNFLVAVLIGLAVGFAGWFVIRQKQANAIWLAPVLGVAGALLASALAAVLGDPGYGPKEFGLQIVLAGAAVGALVAVAMRGQTATAGSAAGASE